MAGTFIILPLVWHSHINASAGPLVPDFNEKQDQLGDSPGYVASSVQWNLEVC